MPTNITKEQYDEIANIANPVLIAKKLKEQTPDFVAEYRRYGNMLRNARFREANKDNINAKRREVRIKNKPVKPIQHIQTTPDFDNIDLDAKRLYKKERALKVPKIKESTLKNYSDIINIIYSKYKNKPLEDDNDILKMLRNEKHNTKQIFKDFNFILKDIADIAKNYNNYLNQLYSIFSLFKTKDLITIRDAIYPYFSANAEHYRDNRQNNIIQPEEIAKISFEPDAVIANIEKLNDPYERLLYALMFKLPTRRLSDFRNMKIAHKPPAQLDKLFNYYYQGVLYINNTKNKKEMKQDINDQPEILKLIAELPEDTDFILGKSYTSPTLSRLFARITKDIYGAPFNAVDIRKINISNSFNSVKTAEDMKLFNANAKNRGHSSGEALNYVLDA